MSFFRDKGVLSQRRHMPWTPFPSSMTTWKNVGWVHDEGNVEIITIARANVRDTSNTTDSFGYGKGQWFLPQPYAGHQRTRKSLLLGSMCTDRRETFHQDNAIQRTHKGMRKCPYSRTSCLPIKRRMGKKDKRHPDARLAFREADKASCASTD